MNEKPVISFAALDAHDKPIYQMDLYDVDITKNDTRSKVMVKKAFELLLEGIASTNKTTLPIVRFSALSPEGLVLSTLRLFDFDLLDGAVSNRFMLRGVYETLLDDIKGPE